MTSPDTRPSFEDLARTLDAHQAPPPQISDPGPFDPTNPYQQTAGPQAMLTTAHILNGRSPEGFQIALLALTIRTAESTTRYVMPRDCALQLGEQIAGAARSMPTLTIADAGTTTLLERQHAAH